MSTDRLLCATETVTISGHSLNMAYTIKSTSCVAFFFSWPISSLVQFS